MPFEKIICLTHENCEELVQIEKYKLLDTHIRLKRKIVVDFLVSELLEGRQLQPNVIVGFQYLTYERKAIPNRQVISLAPDALAALQRVDKHGLVHIDRDVAARNTLVFLACKLLEAKRVVTTSVVHFEALGEYLPPTHKATHTNSVRIE